MAPAPWPHVAVHVLVLTAALWSPACLACTSREQANCNCNSTALTAGVSHVGPMNPYYLDSEVPFQATTDWSFNTSLGLKVYRDSHLVFEYLPLVDNNLECGMDLMRDFLVLSNYSAEMEELEAEATTRPKFLEVVMYVDNPMLNPSQGSLPCASPLCKVAYIHYHYPPMPKNIHIQMSPEDAAVGETANITCSTSDGSPAPEKYTLLLVDLDTGRLLFNSDGSLFTNTIQIEALGRGRYFCQSISFPFGSLTTVKSESSVEVRESTEINATDDKAIAKALEPESGLVDKHLESWLNNITENEEPVTEDASTPRTQIEAAAKKEKAGDSSKGGKRPIPALASADIRVQPPLLLLAGICIMGMM